MSDRLRVLQIGKYYSPVRGGIETQLQRQAEALQEHVDLKIVVANTTPSRAEETVNGVPVTRVSTWATLAGAPICPGMIREIQEFKADIVHLHLPNPGAILAYLASGHSGTLICNYHSDVVRQKYLGKAFEPILNRVLNRADAIIVSSRNYLQSSPVLKKVKSRCHVIPYGIVLRDFEQQNEAAVRNIRQQFGPRIVLAVGRLVYYKGFEYVIRAMSNVDATLLLIGTGKLHDSLASEIRARGLGDKVHLLGDIDDEHLADYYHAADLLVLPSLARAEAFGIVQVEAMACGKPVINTSLDTGVPFVSEHGVTGITVPPRDADALASSIQFLFDHEGIRQSYGEAARRRVHERFSINTMTEHTLELYGRLEPRFVPVVRRQLETGSPVPEPR